MCVYVLFVCLFVVVLLCVLFCFGVGGGGGIVPRTGQSREY